MNQPQPAFPRPARTDDPQELAREILERLTYRIGKDPKVAKPHDWLTATILVVRDRIIDRWMESTRATYEASAKRVYYLCLEFLIGRLMRDAFTNLGLIEQLRAALKALGVDLDVIAELEPDAALGNGGLGRLAACFMESMATRRHPRLWLRHPLRARPVPPGDRRRLAGRAARRPGSPTAIPGSSSAARAPTRSASAATVEPSRRRTARARALRLEAGRARASPSPTTRRSSAGAASASTRCACGRAQPIDPILLDAFNAGDHIGALAREQQGRGASPACSIRPTRTPPARNCGCARSTSSPPPRCRTSCAATCSSIGDLDIAARQGRDPAQRHPSGDRGRRADAPADRRPRHRLRRRPGS